MTERFTSMLSRDKSSEQERHELAVIDAAVRGAATSRPEDAELTDFALKLSAARPLANDGFYREMDERFAVGVDAPSAKQRSPRGLLLGSGAGALLAVVVALVIVGTQTQSDTAGVTAEMPALGRSENAAKKAPAAATEKAFAQQDSAASGGSATGAGPIEPDVVMQNAPRALTTAPGGPRKVEQTANLALATPHAKVETVADGVIHVTDQYHGYVGDSQISGGDAANASAHFDLQIPAQNFQAALADLSKLAHVRSRTQSTQDITGTYRSTRSRLSAARAHRDRIAEELAKAKPGSSEAAALKLQLRRAQSVVAARRAAMNGVRNRVNYVGMSVQVIADESAATDERGTLAKAFDTAGGVLTAIAAVLVIVLAIALPFGIVALVAWATVKRTRRTRRDAALDAAAGPSEA